MSILKYTQYVMILSNRKSSMYIFANTKQWALQNTVIIFIRRFGRFRFRGFHCFVFSTITQWQP